MIEHKKEYFEYKDLHKVIDHSVSVFPKHLYYQESDWTCSIAVLRSITSSIVDIGSEDDILHKYNIKMGPQFSQDIKDYHILDSFDLDILYGCNNKGLDVSDLIDLLDKGYYIATQWMICSEHWTVLLGFAKLGTYDEDVMIHYCPYFNEVKTYKLSEFSDMWKSGNCAINNIYADFIAVRKK